MPANTLVQQNTLGNLPVVAKVSALAQSLHASEQMLARQHWQRRNGVRLREAEATQKMRHRGVNKRTAPRHQKEGSSDGERLDLLV